MSKLSKKIRKLFCTNKDDPSTCSYVDTTDSSVPTAPTKTLTYFSTDKNRYVEATVPERVTVASPSLLTSVTPSIYSTISSKSDSDSDSDSLNDVFRSKTFYPKSDDDTSSIASKSTIYSGRPSSSRRSSSSSIGSVDSFDSASRRSSDSTDNFFSHLYKQSQLQSKSKSTKSDSDSDDYYSSILSEY